VPRAFAIALIALAAHGCPWRADPEQLSPAPGASAPSSASAGLTSTAPADLPPTTRVRGDIDGRFSARRTHVVVGEPVVIDLELRSTRGSLTFSVGGDQRNMATFPTRIAVKAIDVHGAVVCDSVARPALVSFGGPQGGTTLAPGATFRQTFVLNPMCPTLGSPGDLHVTLHRRLTFAGLTLPKPGTRPPRPCDVFPVHEGPLPPSRLPEGYGACEKTMEEAPSITTELDLHVAPFDAAALREATEARLREAGAETPRDDLARYSIAAWVCAWLVCGCDFPKPQGRLEDADVLAVLPAQLPATFPEYCPRKP